MRTSVWIAVSIAAVLLLAGCSAGGAATSVPPQVSSAELNVLGTSAGASQSKPATQTTQTALPNPATVEGIPTSLGVQVALANGSTAISQSKALQISEHSRPTGGTSPAVVHVLFARSGGKNPPVDAWMITYHNGQLPGPGGAAANGSPKMGSVTVFIDANRGAVLDMVAYEPDVK